jgi:hypothetical protein
MDQQGIYTAPGHSRPGVLLVTLRQRRSVISELARARWQRPAAPIADALMRLFYTEKEGRREVGSGVTVTTTDRLGRTELGLPSVYRKQACVFLKHPLARVFSVLFSCFSVWMCVWTCCVLCVVCVCVRVPKPNERGTYVGGGYCWGEGADRIAHTAAWLCFFWCVRIRGCVGISCCCCRLARKHARRQERKEETQGLFQTGGEFHSCINSHLA